MIASRQRLVVWASGMIEFLGEQEEPDGAITVCIANGQAAIWHLFDCVLPLAELHDFGGRVALKVPDIDSRRPQPAFGIDDAVVRLIEWGDLLRDAIDPADPDFTWTRAWSGGPSIPISTQGQGGPV